jgi:hypothetical protein
MTVTAQSSNLSSFSPKLQVYTSALGLVGQAGVANSLGATVSVSTTVAAGQTYYVKVYAAGGYGPIGSYGLLVNMGSQSQSPIAPPNTLVAQQPNLSGGSLSNSAGLTGSDSPGNIPGGGAAYITIGDLQGWALAYTGISAAPTAPASPTVIPPVSSPSPTSTQGPVAPIVTTPTSAPSPIVETTIITTKHHVHSKPHPKPTRYFVGARGLHVKDHAKPKHLSKS